MFTIRWMSLAAITLSWLLPNLAQAQPMRQLPGTRPFLVGMMPQQGAPLNPRVRPAASSVGVESTDFYGKKGYPKQLGDFYEAASGVSGAATTGVAGGNNGNQGVQASGSSGFQGNTGNQIGQNGGGTILGGLFGGGGGAAGGGAAGFSAPSGLTGGGFAGMSPKGFGFGGTP
ncbi:MAG: hypothetical protein QM703_16635 [Gemmatales bacterium]